MSVFRLMAITLPMTILIACGGGGGGGTTSMTGMPTTTTPPPTVTPEVLPDALIADAGVARMRVGGSEATPDMNSEQIKQTLRSIASASSSEVIFSDIIETSSATPTSSTVTCSTDNRSCSGDLSDGTMIEFSLDNFGGTPEVNNADLVGFSDQYSLVMTDRNVTLAQARAAGRLDGVRFEFQSYGGWLANSAFAVQSEVADGSGNSDISYLTAYSFGDVSRTNPTGGSGSAEWNGAMVGANKETGHIIQGGAQVVIDNLSVPRTFVVFSGMRNLNTGGNFGTTMSWSLPIVDGAFESDSGDIKGSFYGSGSIPPEVGGTFDRNNVLGAFGATLRTQ